jgi:hypothetical protein
MPLTQLATSTGNDGGNLTAGQSRQWFLWAWRSGKVG